MRIAVFTDTFQPEINGVTKTLEKMRLAMEERGIEYLFFVPGEGSLKTGAPGTASFSSFRFFAYPQCRIALPDYGVVKRRLDVFKPDIIHLTTPFPIGLCGMRYAREQAVPHTATYHTDFPEYLDHYGLGILKKGAWQYFKWFHESSDINFAPSEQTRLKMEAMGIRRLALWKRGIETERFHPRFRDETLRFEWTNGNGDIPCLVHVGRLAREKELDVLMDAVEILNAREVPFQLVLVGDGPMRAQLEARAASNVRFSGYRTGTDLSRHYASGDLFCFTSGTETYGNVLLEAMASGLPTVSVREGGASENVVDGVNSLVFKRGSGADMADRIERLLADAALRDRLAEGALRHVRNKDWTSVFDDLFQRYGRLMDRAGGERDQKAS